MKYSIFFKGLVLFLTVLCLFTTLVCGFGIFLLSQIGIYNGGYHTYLEREWEERAELVARAIGNGYAISNYSAVPESLKEHYGYTDSVEQVSHRFSLRYGQWGYAIHDLTGNQLTVSEGYEEVPEKNAYGFYVDTMCLAPASAQDGSSLLFEDELGSKLYFQWQKGPVYYVEIRLTDSVLTDSDIPMMYIQWAERWQYAIIFLLIGAVAVGVVCTVYLCCAAGRSAKGAQVSPRGLNCLPLDLYTAGAAIICVFCAWLVCDGLIDMCLTEDYYINAGMAALTGMVILSCLTVFVSWCYCVITQIKVGKFYWWHHSVMGWILGKFFKGIGFVCKNVYRGITALYRLLPVTGKRVLILCAFFFAGLLVLVLMTSFLRFFGVLLLLGLILGGLVLFGYDIYCFGTVMQGAKRMAEGNLSVQIPTRYLMGSYKEHAQRLNAIADVATVAAKQQMKSERMKAELITNVSHDIKTPLTSIINYVDLLQQAASEEEKQQYLEVLERQSGRMKKLLEDLLEMSKASTGNIAVDINRVDAAEAVNQALGEFSDKLAAAHLTPVFQQPEKPVYMMADGRLVWRVLSNLLSNAVKYALPDTRVYLNLVQEQERVQLCIKNISREPLNIQADELAERFVRGDASRNTEGSGLGLNIATSLMDLQRGTLALTVDGDLFKVTLTFPAG